MPRTAKAWSLPRMTRADLNAAFFNAATRGIGIGGTSGKSTVTAMVAWLLHSAGLSPTVMNGAVMRNFSSAADPFTSALIGGEANYVSEVDESDGSIALLSARHCGGHQHQPGSQEPGRAARAFRRFRSARADGDLNADDPESAALIGDKSVTFGFGEGAAVRASDYAALPDGCEFTLTVDGSSHAVRLKMPGRHNVANALAALAVARAVGLADGRSGQRRSPILPGCAAL